jgi:hypothetical protein
MRINELLIESQQLDEGPFTQAIGKVGGKIAKGVANIGKDLKTGFKAGYSGEEPPADTKAKIDPTMDPAVASPKQAAPVKKAGGGFIDQFKKGFAQGRGEPAADPAASTAPTSSAATTSASTTDAAPVADPAAEKQSKIGVGQINKIIPTLRTRDLMSLKKNLDAVIAKKSAEKPAAAAPAAGPNWDAETGEPLSAKAKAEYQTFSPEQKAEIQKNIKNKSSVKQNVAASQAEIDADRERLLPQNSSVIRTGNSLAETLARKVQEQKQRMFETALMSGTQSVFKK